MSHTAPEYIHVQFVISYKALTLVGKIGDIPEVISVFQFLFRERDIVCHPLRSIHFHSRFKNLLKFFLKFQNIYR